MLDPSFDPSSSVLLAFCPRRLSDWPPEEGQVVTMGTRRSNHEGGRPVRRSDGRWTAKIAWHDGDGKGHRVSVYGKTHKECVAKTKAIAKRLDTGHPGVDSKVTLGAFAQQWISGSLAASDRKPSTKAGYAILARKHVVGSNLLGSMPLSRVRPSTVERWIVGLRETGLSESTVRTTYTVLRAILDTAVRDGLAATNPAAVVKRPRVTHHEAAYLSAEQVRALLTAAEETRYGVVFNLLAGTGLRRGEALALTWRDIDFDQRTIRVRGTLARIDGELVVSTPKSAKSRRTIPMTLLAEKALKAAKSRQRTERLRAGSKWAATGYVFTTELGEASDPRNALRALNAAAGKAGLEGISIHTLRHSAATMLLTGGEAISTVSVMLGHASIAVTVDLYGHVSPDVARTAMNTLDKALNA
jgi:integrase